MEKKLKIKNGIGYSSLTKKIYLGRQNIEKGLWVGDKEDITSDFISVLFQFLPENTSRTLVGLDTMSENIVINFQNNNQSIKKAIKFLQQKLKQPTK